VGGQSLQPEFVPDPVDGSFDLYYWDESAPGEEGWINVRDSAGAWNPQFEDSFITDKGYLVAYSESNSGDNTRIFSGQVNSGNSAIPLAHGGNNWNLLGNPYPCAIEWSSAGIDKSAVAAGAMYIWDPALNDNNGGYRAHNGTTGVPAGTSSVIPAMQGFFVQSLIADTLTIEPDTDEPLVHGGQPFYKNTKQLAGERIRIKVMHDFFTDETLLYFDPAASNDFDPGYDAEKLFNGLEGCPEVFSFAGNDTPLCFNILSTHPVSVSLGIKYSGYDSLTITAFDFDEFSTETGIFLEDTELKILKNLRDEPDYHFLHNPLQTGTRFVLHFMNVAGLADHLQPCKPVVRCSGNRIFIKNPCNSGGNVDIHSLDGRCIITDDIPAGESNFSLAVPCGLYLVSVTTGSGILREKIIIR
jgi:hypothetical protein